MPLATSRAISSQNSSDGSIYTVNRQLMLPITQQQAVRRSSSQDQLYSIMPGQMQQRAVGRTMFNTSNQTNVPLSHYQHYQPHRNIGFSTFPHSHLKPVHLTSSTPSPSPSSSISTYPGSATYMNQPQSSQHIYQTPLVLNASVTSTASGIYGHLRTPHQLLQPSVSYQNLHYNTEIAANNEMNLVTGGNEHAQMAYTRPMTSIGIIPLHSTLSPLNRTPDSVPVAGGNGIVVSPSRLAIQQMHLVEGEDDGAGLSGLSLSNPSNQLARQMTFSSNSSASLPSTPEHSSQPSQFPYIRTIQPSKQVSPETMKQSASTITPPPNLTVDNGSSYVDGSASSIEHYGVIYPEVSAQPQSLYGTIGPQNMQNRQPLVTMKTAIQQQSQQSNVLPSTKVRTRYRCIGGNDSELSFQPNMIITNGK